MINKKSMKMRGFDSVMIDAGFIYEDGWWIDPSVKIVGVLDDGALVVKPAVCPDCHGNHYLVDRDGGTRSCYCVSDSAKIPDQPRRRSKKSPTEPGNVRCMDCRCNGHGCPGMPAGYEENLMRNW